MSENINKKNGRPPFKPTEEQFYSVSLMAAIGIVHDEIAKALGISDETLRKYFSQELMVGKTKTITKVADSLVRQALAGNMTAAIFFLKTQAGWKETNIQELVGKDGSSLSPPIFNVNFGKPDIDGD